MKNKKKNKMLLIGLVAFLAIGGYILLGRKRSDNVATASNTLSEEAQAVVENIENDYPEEKKLAAQCVTAWDMSPGGKGGPTKWRNWNDSDKMAKQAISQVYSKNLNAKAFREAFDTMATGTFSDAVIKHLSNGERKKLRNEISYCLA